MEAFEIDSQVPDRPYLDRPVVRRGEALGPAHRVVERVGLDQVVAAELLLRLGEGTVGDEALAATEADGARSGRRLERGRVDEGAGLPKVLREVHVGADYLLPELGRDTLAPALVGVQKQHEPHRPSLAVSVYDERGAPDSTLVLGARAP